MWYSRWWRPSCHRNRLLGSLGGNVLISLGSYRLAVFTLTVWDVEKVSAINECFVKVVVSGVLVCQCLVLLMVNTAVQLAEDAKGCKAHPREKTLILVAVVLSIRRVQLPNVSMPVGRWRCPVEGTLQFAHLSRTALPQGWILNCVLGRPGDARAEEWHLEEVFVVMLANVWGKRRWVLWLGIHKTLWTYLWMLHYFEQLNGVIEETVGNHSTGRNGRMSGVIEVGVVASTDLLWAIQVAVQLDLITGLRVGKVTLKEWLNAVVDEDVPGNAVVEGDEEVAKACVWRCSAVATLTDTAAADGSFVWIAQLSRARKFCLVVEAVCVVKGVLYYLGKKIQLLSK